MTPFELACRAGLYALGQFLAYLAVSLVALVRAYIVATMAIRSLYVRPIW